MDYGCIEQICKKYNTEYKFNEKLSKYTSFQIGGCCDILVKPQNTDCVIEILDCCRNNNIKHYILGRGSNVLVSDNGLRGVVIVLAMADVRFEDDDEHIYCDAGASLAKVCAFAKDNSLTGLEFAYGIPGSVGGALYMNAGAYDGEMKNIVEYCVYIDEQFKVNTMKAEDMQLSYRHSIFCESNNVIIGVVLKLKKGNKDEIRAKMSELMEKRRSKQPLEYPSAGSTFKRPVGDFAARLIEVSGLKGYTCGGAQVSEKHSGFVINKGNATFDDVMNVVKAVKDKVYADSGVMLECEIEILE